MASERGAPNMVQVGALENRFSIPEANVRKPAFTLLLVLAAAACASSGTARASRPDADLITRAEIDEAGPSSAYDLIQKLRPTWLRKRGNTSFTQETDLVVYLDGVRMGNRDALRNISTNAIQSIEYLDSRRATNRFGSGHVAGAILIHTGS